MAQGFRFDFASEDVGGEDNESQNYGQPAPMEHIEPLGNPPELHSVDELLSTLPSRLSYTTVDILNSKSGSTISLLRRELFDIRTQLMAEDTCFDTSLTEGLSHNDITPNIYEGGFKTWECSFDLGKYLVQCLDLTSGTIDRKCHFIELGAGTALPIAVIFFLLLNRPHSAPLPPVYVTLCDYNASVLSLATLPNLLLVWASLFHPTLFPTGNGEVDITPTLLSSFVSDLSTRNIHISFISGSWSTELVFLINSSGFLSLHSPSSSTQESAEPIETLILASETIYSPSNMRAFTSTVLSLLSTSSSNQRRSALIAAKKVYFGVGGGIDEFLRVLDDMQGLAKCVWDSDGEGAGVGRCIIEVTRRKGM